MKNATAFTCYLIGQEQLLIDCAQILQSHGVKVKGIISSSAPIQVWAQQHHICCVECLTDINWDVEAVDYLFSIVNRDIIPSAILTKVLVGTVVYHDSTLPRYTGTHASAVLNQEASYGISWHLANALENSGVILKRAQINVEPGMTTEGLRARCLAWAITTFGELVTTLLHHALEPHPHDIAERTWISFYQKPWSNGWIDWKYTAEEIECYWRATQFGTAPTTFTTLKMICAGQAFVIQSVRVLPISSDGMPGKVVVITEDHWQIITGSSDLIIVIDFRKNQIKMRADILAQHCNLKVNDQLMSPDPEQLQQFQAISEQCVGVELDWVQTLKHFHATPVIVKASIVGRQTLPKTLYFHLLDFSRKVAELPLVLLTAWLVYLFRLGGQRQISLCLLIRHPQIPLASQPFFSSALPCCFTISESDNFVQQLKRVRLAFEAQLLKKPYLIDLWHRYPELADIVAPEQQSVPVDMDFEHEHQDIGNIGEELPDAFASLCTQLLLHTNVPVSEIEWLGKKEKHKILVEWNATDVVYPEHKTIHRLFEEQVYKTPEQLALIAEDSVLTYHELNCRVNQLAHYLITFHAIKPDEPVAIYLERGSAMLVAELGVLKAGGACLPLDPNWSASHIVRILTDANAHFVITTEALLRRLHASPELIRQSRHIFVLDSPLSALMLLQQSTTNTRVPVKSEQLAFLLYSAADHLSPLGVALEHRGIVNQMIWLNELRPLTAGDRILQHSSYVAHYSLLEFFWANWFGATLVSSNDDNQCEPAYLCGLIQEKQVTAVQLVPVRLHAMMQHLSQQSMQLSSLRQIFCHGPDLDAGTRLAVHTLLPGVRLHYLYGSAETSLHVLHAESLAQQEELTGTPISNIRAYVLDEKLHPLPAGVRGELYISGEGLARGYVNQSELTRQKFIPNPFQSELDKKDGRHARLYKTGDLLCWLPEGRFEFKNGR